MINTLRHLINLGDSLTILLSFVFLIYGILLICFYKKIVIEKKKIKLWRVLCIIPFCISIIHFLIFTFGSAFLEIFNFYFYFYMPSWFILLFLFFKKNNLAKKLYNVLTVIICLICFLMSFDSGKVFNFTRKSLTDAYVSLCDSLEKYYVLSEWKKIDYEKLKEEGLVLVSEAEKNNDIDKYYEAIDNLLDSFYDGHMGFSFYNTDYDYTVSKILEFNDYGLSLITLDDGSTIAINVADNLDIKNGDRVIKWNGVDINEAIDSVEIPVNEGLVENERIQKAFYLAGVGEDTVDVTYINSLNEEVVVTLEKLDSEIPRALSSFGILNHTRNEEYMYKMLNDDTGYLRVVSEETNWLSDNLAYVTGNHTYAREMFREDLRELKEKGMTKLIIDIRNNSGGYEEVSTALTSLFTKEKMYAFSLGIRNKKKNYSIEDRYVLSDGEFSDLEIVVLTGMRCGSAGDGLGLYLSRLDNVVVAGLTNPSGINQEIGGYVYMPENVLVTFPTGIVLDKDGNPNIDIDDTRESRNPVDIKIPLDKDAALKLFSGEDYELEWAIDYLK